MTLIEDKEREFHRHIKKNRVDPTLQSTSNPVPDFYGEKIGSIKEYRQWLRDQVCTCTPRPYRSDLTTTIGAI